MYSNLGKSRILQAVRHFFDWSSKTRVGRCSSSQLSLSAAFAAVPDLAVLLVVVTSNLKDLAGLGGNPAFDL